MSPGAYYENCDFSQRRVRFFLLHANMRPQFVSQTVDIIDVLHHERSKEHEITRTSRQKVLGIFFRETIKHSKGIGTRRDSGNMFGGYFS